MVKDCRIDISSLVKGEIISNAMMLSDYRTDNPDPVPLMYQTGYLTIVSGDVDSGTMTLGFPNQEVRYGFLESLLPEYIHGYENLGGMNILYLRMHLMKGDVGKIRDLLVAFFAGIPYPESGAPFESDFRNVMSNFQNSFLDA